MPHVLRWLGGFATSLVGNQIYLVALAWVAVQTTTPANVGWILVAGAIPQAALLLVGGALVDRLGPKRVILVSDVLRTVVMMVLACSSPGTHPASGCSSPCPSSSGCSTASSCPRSPPRRATWSPAERAVPG